MKGFHWVTDAHYMVVPKGVSDEKLAVVLDLMAYLLTPEAQANTYDKGYFYPGPAVKDVPLSMAPQESQDAIKEFGRPEYEQTDRRRPARGAARCQGPGRRLHKWDQEIGGAEGRRSEWRNGFGELRLGGVTRRFGGRGRASTVLDLDDPRAASSSRCSARPAAASRRRSTASPACCR